MRRSESLASEPMLSDVLDDPIVRLIMRRDGLTPEGVLAAIMPVVRHLKSRRIAPAIDAAA